MLYLLQFWVLKWQISPRDGHDGCDGRIRKTLCEDFCADEASVSGKYYFHDGDVIERGKGWSSKGEWGLQLSSLSRSSAFTCSRNELNQVAKTVESRHLIKSDTRRLIYVSLSVGNVAPCLVIVVSGRSGQEQHLRRLGC